jgi:hypothetical protein
MRPHNVRKTMFLKRAGDFRRVPGRPPALDNCVFAN